LAKQLLQDGQSRVGYTQATDLVTDTRFISKIIKGLPVAYASWIERYHDITADPDAPNPSLKSVEAQLIAKEASLPKITATANKGRNRDKDKNKDKDGKDRDPSKYADGTIKDKCTYEPCGKWGHKEETCFMKDPSKKKPRSESTPKPATAKPSGFAAVATADSDAFDKQLNEASIGWTLVTDPHSKTSRHKQALTKFDSKQAVAELDSLLRDGQLKAVPKGKNKLSYGNNGKLIATGQLLRRSSNVFDVDISNDDYDTIGLNISTHGTSQTSPSSHVRTPADVPPQAPDLGGRNGSRCDSTEDGLGCDQDKAVRELIDDFSNTSDGTVLAAMAIKDVTLSRDAWLYDSACNIYICNDPAWFSVLHPFDMTIATADNVAGLEIQGGGTVVLQLRAPDGNPFPLSLSRVAFAPAARANLMSMSKLAAAGITGTYNSDVVTLCTPDGHHFGNALQDRGLYHFDFKAQAAEYAEASHPDLWAKTSVFTPGWFLGNYLSNPLVQPRRVSGIASIDSSHTDNFLLRKTTW
jgi:hypothetical protein